MELGSSAVSVEVASEAADRAMRRFTGLLRAGVDPGARVSKEWTIRDVAAHVAGLLPIYVRMVQGEPSPVASLEGLGELNDRLLSVDEQSLYNFADVIDREMAALIDAVGDAVGDTGSGRAIGWHAGMRLPLSTVLGLLAGEGYVHGHDVARSARMAWEVAREDAVTVFQAILPVIPAMVDRDRAGDLTGTVEIRLRGAEDGRWSFVFLAGALKVERADGRPADWVMSSEPVGQLLASYGRMSPLKGMLTGRILGWGRNPALGLRFARAFRRP